MSVAYIIDSLIIRKCWLAYCSSASQAGIYISQEVQLSVCTLACCCLYLTIYRIAGFICEVLICANYARRCGLAEFNSDSIQHFSNKTGPNILVNMISSNHRIYGKGFYCRNEFRSHCTCSNTADFQQGRVIDRESKICTSQLGFIIADITAGLKNCMFAEIAPRTFYPLYGMHAIYNL